MVSSSFVTADQVIATAASIIEDADTMDRAFFKEWIYLGLQQIGPTDAWVTECTLYPNDGLQLPKPKDMYMPLDLGLYDVGGNELRYSFRGLSTRIHQSGNTTLDAGQYAPEFGAPIDLSEDSYYFHLGTNSSLVSYAVLKYLKYPVDEVGNLLIPEKDILPLSFFLKYMWYCRKDDKVGMGQWNNKWIAARNEARGEHRIPSILDATEIARGWTSMIQKLRFKIF